MRFNPIPGAKGSRLRRGIFAGAALVLTSGAAVAMANQAMAASGCSVSYSTNSWSNGFTATVAVTNLGDSMTSWDLEFDFAGNQAITQAWNGTYSQSGTHVTLSNASWNGDLATNATVNPGFQATYSGTNTDPTSFTLNGVACTGSTNASSSASATASSSPTVTPSSSSSGGGSTGTHVDNPYADATVYVNPEWSALAAAEQGGTAISDEPTFVWMDRIAAIEGVNGAMGMVDHLDAALEQGVDVVQFVIYDLPGRDCAALASNGELGATEIDRYKTEYIDPIAAIQSDSKYSDLRIVNIIEIDSLPNLITNAGSTETTTDACVTMKENGNYVTGIQYALSMLHAAGTNNYEYIDAAHHGWLGWDSNFSPAADLFYTTAAGAVGGVETVDGFITNTANYSALTEPYMTISSTVNGTSIRQSDWVDWNQYVDELTYAQAFRTELISKGFGSSIGMLIDTGRNGWGGTARPTAASTSTDLNTWVDESRIDLRIHAGNWCNQSGAGIGERPQASPATGIDAYVWAKPPGESDGASEVIENDEGKGFDEMCDPDYEGNARNGYSLTGALDDAPLSGHWFSAQFQELLANAYPAL